MPAAMTWEQLDWSALDRMRELFLRAEPVREAYWRTESDLASYDFTYAQRIGWKWDAALAELARLGWTPPAGPLLDWGCGSGVASRCVISAFGQEHFPEVRLHDRSALAMNFAAKRASERFPGIRVSAEPSPSDPVTTLVVSHVLNELHRDDLPRLMEAVSSAQCVLWVEPGTHAVSRGLITLRERLRSEFYIVAPCPHRDVCGLAVTGKENDWCHFFAKAPSGVFTDSNWVKFGQRAGIDLRSLPYSWLVLDRRPVAEWPADTGRVLSHPEIFKPYARAVVCRKGETGVVEFSKRSMPEEFRRLKGRETPPDIRLQPS